MSTSLDECTPSAKPPEKLFAHETATAHPVTLTCPVDRITWIVCFSVFAATLKGTDQPCEKDASNLVGWDSTGT